MNISLYSVRFPRWHSVNPPWMNLWIQAIAGLGQKLYFFRINRNLPAVILYLSWITSYDTSSSLIFRTYYLFLPEATRSQIRHRLRPIWNTQITVEKTSERDRPCQDTSLNLLIIDCRTSNFRDYRRIIYIDALRRILWTISTWNGWPCDRSSRSVWRNNFDTPPLYVVDDCSLQFLNGSLNSTDSALNE